MKSDPKYNQTYKRIETKVMIRIEQSRLNRARLYLTLHISSVLVALFAFIPVVKSFANASSQSGFSTYLSLFSSDWSYALASWKDFSLSLVESMPIIETVLIVGLLLIIANALRRGFRYVPSIHYHEHLAA